MLFVVTIDTDHKGDGKTPVTGDKVQVARMLRITADLVDTLTLDGGLVGHFGDGSFDCEFSTR